MADLEFLLIKSLVPDEVIRKKIKEAATKSCLCPFKSFKFTKINSYISIFSITDTTEDGIKTSHRIRVGHHGVHTVSYTHLTLPTIYSV